MDIYTSFQISLGRVLKAALIFKGIMIEWVTVKGFDEVFEDVDDLWSESKYQVFRKVQDHTHSAMLHFYSPTLPELAVRSFMVIIFFSFFLFSVGFLTTLISFADLAT